MAGSVPVRIELEDGDWWDLETNPKWGVVKRINAETDPSEILATFTLGWSWEEEVSAANIDERAMVDVSSVFNKLNSDVLPKLDRSAPNLSQS
jgi:hypothetical protein